MILNHSSSITYYFFVMPEVQKTVQTGEMTQRFIQFVMMHAQNAALFLGQIPNPKTGEAEINLDLARMFIDQLEMIQEKTRGNLTNEETMVLRNALSNLQMAFVEAWVRPSTTTSAHNPKRLRRRPHNHRNNRPQALPSNRHLSPRSEPEPESRKKFTKSYGP